MAERGIFACAQISCMQGRFHDALDEISTSLIRNWHNHKARALKAAILRKLGQGYNENDDDNKTHNPQPITHNHLNSLIKESLEIDPFNYGILYEAGRIDEMKQLMHNDANNYNELALDYWNAGFYEDADKIWAIQAEVCNLDEISFPNRIEDIFLLKDNYKLGCLYYDKRQYDLAQECWENTYRSIQIALRCIAAWHWSITTNSTLPIRLWPKWNKLSPSILPTAVSSWNSINSTKVATSVCRTTEKFRESSRSH